ncbi:MAG: enoyl-CoA hydratase [Phyllobacteriaceae bacterium]|nr:enoyl-CoA hydratase [Phyllobacteriaceae bacterium]MBA93294.1 enoyl-CoA hydratase [Phyllobacteriaceae bacterium]
MHFDDITYAADDGVATITFNRLDVMNAARMQTQEELVAALDAADADDGVRCVIVTGEGRAFCAGTDISDGFRLPAGGDPASGEGIPADIGGITVLRLFEMRKPVIGAINGAAVGFGATFTLAMDIRLVSDGAKFAFPFTRRGICAESCSSWFLPRLVGLQTAMDWMLTGRTFLADEALQRGLAHECLPAENLMERARAMARDIADNCAPVSLAINRQMLLRMMGAEHPRIAHELESRALAACLAAPDAAEGVASFREKRPPCFTGTVSDAGYMRNWWS